MIYKKFNSSTLFSASYIEETNVLEVKFNRGATYRYFDVPKDKFLALCVAESAGSFFNKNIAAKFKYVKLEN